MDFADENAVVVDMPANEQSLAVFRVAGDEGVLGNVAVSAGGPVAGRSTHQNLKVGLDMCVEAPSHEKLVPRRNNAAYKTLRRFVSRSVEKSVLYRPGVSAPLCKARPMYRFSSPSLPPTSARSGMEFAGH